MAKETSFISLVLYVHNNEDSIIDSLERIIAEIQLDFKHYEIILVDDASTDNSVHLIKEFASGCNASMLQLIEMSYFHGIESAMNAGINLAIGDFIFEIDSCTIDYEPHLLLDVFHRSQEGYDIVSASPHNTQSIASSFFYYLINRFSEVQRPLLTERFRLLSRRAINRIHAMNLNIPYRKILYAQSGLLHDVYIYTPLTTTFDTTTNDNEYRWRIAIDSLVLFTDIGYKAAAAMSMCMLLLTLILGTFAVINFFTNQPATGWTSMICVLAIGFFCMFALFAVIIKYLDIIIRLIFKKTNICYKIYCKANLLTDILFSKRWYENLEISYLKYCLGTRE